jgi:ABC-2 type transport system ATP-binding protein
MAVQEYLLMMAELRGIRPDRQKSLLSDAIYSTAIETKLTQPLGSLSKGFRQRVCLAQAILHKPQVLILDEPTNGLDPTQIIEMRSLIKRLAEHATVMVSTHILSEVEATCHRAIIIMEGLIKADAKLDELTSTSAAVVSIERGPTNIEAALSTISGIHGVREEGPSNGFVRYRITAAKDMNLCPAIYDVARQQNWRLAELRPETRTLESVFRELAERGGISA